MRMDIDDRGHVFVILPVARPQAPWLFMGRYSWAWGLTLPIQTIVAVIGFPRKFTCAFTHGRDHEGRKETIS